jgi:HSP20 family protein
MIMKNAPSLLERTLAPSWLGRPSLRGFMNLQRRMDRMMDEFNQDLAELPAAAGFEPSCDVEEFPTHYLFSMDVPGIKKENIKIELTGQNDLCITGERKIDHETKTGTSYQKERYFGSFERIFSLPAAVKAEQIEAQYKDGVLQIVVPKSEVSKSKQIKISEGKLWSEKTSS